MEKTIKNKILLVLFILHTIYGNSNDQFIYKQACSESSSIPTSITSLVQGLGGSCSDIITLSNFKINFKIGNATVDPYILIPQKCVQYHRTQTIALSSTHFNSLRLAFPLPFESLKPFSQSFALQPRRLGLSYKNKEINLEHVY